MVTDAQKSLYHIGIDTIRNNIMTGKLDSMKAITDFIYTYFEEHKMMEVYEIGYGRAYMERDALDYYIIYCEVYRKIPVSGYAED